MFRTIFTEQLCKDPIVLFDFAHERIYYGYTPVFEHLIYKKIYFVCRCNTNVVAKQTQMAVIASNLCNTDIHVS